MILDRYRGFDSFSEGWTDILGGIASTIFKGGATQPTVYVPPPPPPFFETGGGIAVIAVGGLGLLGALYLATKPKKTAPVAGYRRRRRYAR